MLSSDDEEEIKTSVGEYKRDLQRHEQNMDLLNRTFPGRLNDHIQFLVDLGVSKVDSYFIDIGPGVADHHDQEQNIRRNYPAITSVEMAKALKKITIALDLPESVDALMNARRKDSKIGAELLGRDDIQVLSGDEAHIAQGSNRKKRDALGQSIKLPDSNDIIIVRACNSIDIYCDWSQVKTSPQKNGRRFQITQDDSLFLEKKILAKKAGKTWFTIIGDVSDRGFNHNEQTTKHVPRECPCI